METLWWKKILEKIFSARFIMAVVFSATYCGMLLGCVYLVTKGKMDTPTLVALIGAFAIIVREIAEWYFIRPDRKNENGAEHKEEKK